MKKQYFQSQYILNKVYDNNDNILRVTMNTSQDYLNAVYDMGNNALRVNVGGAMLPLVPDVDSLPPFGDDHQLCPVYNAEKNCIDFYEWDSEKGEWIYRGSTNSAPFLTPEEREALDWLVENLDELRQIIGSNYVVKSEEIRLPKDTTVVVVQGTEQNIDDDLNKDGDDSTPYRIDIKGYVLNVSTYAEPDSPIPDVYYTQITYESEGGGYGTSHIYIQQDEYNHFADYPEGKNIIRVYYIVPSIDNPVKRLSYIMNGDGTVTDRDGNIISLEDLNDKDGDSSTMYRLDLSGYSVGVETFATEMAKVPDKCYMKMTYESDGAKTGHSSIYMSKEEYDFFSAMKNGHNLLNVYYLESLYPSSVSVGEVEYMFPDSSIEFVAVDAYGNVHDISDADDSDGDMETKAKITVNGYVVDTDGYMNESDPIKKRIMVKMSYNNGNDTTDIYIDKDYYDYVSSLGQGKNKIGVYFIGAGSGVDVSKIIQTDSSLDGNSIKPVQNKAVKEAVDSLSNEIDMLRNRISELEKR